MTDKMSTETIYGTIQEQESHVMSERVQSLAATVYKEFEKVIKRYDEDVVKDLMPLVVGILESLDAAFTEKQELDVEIELLREDNEQLLTQYEREKQLRKSADQKYLELEDNVDGTKKELEDKVETLESLLRMSEIKSKNSADHVSRLEEKENESKGEYTKLHERYTELFRTHMDYMERTKILMGTDKLSELTSNSPRVNKGFHLPGLRPVSVAYGGMMEFGNRFDNSRDSTPLGFDSASTHQGSNLNLKNELGNVEPVGHIEPKEVVREKTIGTNIPPTSSPTQESTTTTITTTSTSATNNAHLSNPKPSVIEGKGEKDKISQDRKEQKANVGENESVEETKVVMRKKKRIPEETMKFEDSMSFEEHPMPGLNETLASIVATTPELEDSQDSLVSQEEIQGKRKSVRNDNSIFEELSIQGTDMIAEVDFGADITDSDDNAGEEENDEDDDKENDKDSVGDNFFGMGKELENLILENTELLATKNALNIVKDDLIAKVDELSSEQEILREEITSLQAVRGRLQLRITQLEEELKKIKEENDKKKEENQEKGEDESDVPMAQRKRFTRVEMARVLMERNQYKERLMELQEAVRWTEMIRASREHPGELQPKKKSTVWNFFSNLFSSSNKPKRPLPAATVKYNAPTTHVQPVGDPNKKSRDKGSSSSSSSNPKSKAYDFLQEDLTSEKAKRERERERREQYKQVRAHVKKEDGRMQAYGWSLPAKLSTQVARADTSGKANIPVPVPVYCRPLFDNQMGWKIWCAAGVNLTGGRTRDGGSIVGASVFYSNPPEELPAPAKNDVDKLDKEIKDHEKNVKEDEKDNLSSLVWVCTSTLEASRVSIIDANNPADVLETFRVSVSHILCIASIPGATESDYPVSEEILNAEVPDLPKETLVSSGNSQANAEGSIGVGGVTFVQCATGESSPVTASPIGSLTEAKSGEYLDGTELAEEVVGKDVPIDGNEDEEGDPLGAAAENEISPAQVYRAKGSPVTSTPSTPTHTSRLPPSSSAHSELVLDGRTSPGTSENFLQTEETEKLSSVLPTMWMGSQSGSLYVHSSVSNWKKCLHSVKLRDSILGIVHVKGRVLVSQADGTVAIFHRAADGQWDLLNYHLLDLGKPKQSIRCMTVVAGKDVWCGYKNKIHVVNPQSMKVEKSFDAHPRKESCVRQLCWVGDGVWVSIRLDSTLRLYHAYTHQHLQDVDIEPYISKMLGTGKLGFSFVRITAMLISCNRLWIGTGNGVIISVPLSENNKQPMITTSVSLGVGGGGGGIGGFGSCGSGGRPGGVVRVYSDSKTDSVTPGSFIPYCSMAQAQLSFHGHKDAVKFFVSVPARQKKSALHAGLERKGLSAASEPSRNSTSTTASAPGEASPAPKSNTRLVLSGGEGYVDFRMGDGEEEDPATSIPPEMCNDDDDENNPSKGNLSKVDRSHVIVWQVSVNQS